MAVSIDYIPKIQARKFSLTLKKLDVLKTGAVSNATVMEEVSVDATDEFEIIEEMETEEVTSFMEIMPSTPPPLPIKTTILRLILKLQKKVVLLDYLR
jgi:hypothetical protein